MKKIIITLYLLIVTLSVSFAQEDWNAKLKKDLVTISDSKFKIESFELLTFANDATLQYKTTATGPTNVISRDQFVSIYSTFGTFMLISILGEAGVNIDDVDIQELDELIGEADISIHMEMAKNGMQLAITTSDGTERQTITWKEFFEDN